MALKTCKIINKIPGICRGFNVIREKNMKVEHNSRQILYRSPFGAVKSQANVRIRIAIGDCGIPSGIKLCCEFKDEKYAKNMDYIFSVGEYSVYETEILMPDDKGNLWYYFEINTDFGGFYYANNDEGLGGIGKLYEKEGFKKYQITVYSPSYKTPEWFKNSVVYQIFPDRFYIGDDNASLLDNRCDIIKRGWGEKPFYKKEQFGGEYLANDFFGGTLKGIADKLEYLSELGIDAIYLNPIFKAYSNHKYDTADFEEIETTLGTKEDFLDLCKKASGFGIKIILDGVFNHVGSNSKYFNKNNEYDEVGAYQSKQSKYFDWFSFRNWPDDYDSWWGIKTLPSINENSKSYRDYILNGENSIVKQWIKNGAMGWRLDVVDELPGFFVKELRKAVKSVNDDAIIIGEVWEDASNKKSYGEKREYLLGDELDSVMNYPLRSALIAFAKRNIDAKAFDEKIMSIKENYPSPAFYSLLNFLSGHDVKRIITAVGNAPDENSVDRDFMQNFRLTQEEYINAKAKVKQIVAMQMLLPGVPCIFYGDEIGLQGYGDPFCRGCFSWDDRDDDLYLWYKNMINIRKSSKAFIEGNFESVYKYEYVYAFIREFEDDFFMVCTNFSDKNERIRIDIGRYDIRMLENKDNCCEKHISDNGIFYVDLSENEVKIFRCKKS